MDVFNEISDHSKRSDLCWWFHSTPFANICSSIWIILPGIGMNIKTYLKPPPSREFTVILPQLNGNRRRHRRWIHEGASEGYMLTVMVGWNRQITPKIHGTIVYSPTFTMRISHMWASTPYTDDMGKEGLFILKIHESLYMSLCATPLLRPPDESHVWCGITVIFTFVAGWGAILIYIINQQPLGTKLDQSQKNKNENCFDHDMIWCASHSSWILLFLFFSG